MSLASRISDLATAIALEFNSVRSEKVGSSDGSVENVIALTQAAYDALPVKDPKTIYHTT